MLGISYDRSGAHMSKLVIFGLIGLFILSDQIASRLADQKIRSNGIFESAISALMPSLDELSEPSAKTCEVKSIYAIYLYQFCFRPYTAGTERNQDGYHLIYHKPKPKLSLFMPANSPDNYYFKESSQGEFILFAQRDGTIQYGDTR